MPKKLLLASVLPVLATCVALAAGSPTTAAAKSASTASASCSASKLGLHTPGVLTVATDSPAYPPYFENNKPVQRQGLRERGRLRRRQAARLRDQARSSGSSSRSTPPTPRAPRPSTSTSTRSRSRRRAPQEVTFSTPYYTNPQAIIVDRFSPLAHAKSLAAFKNATIGVQIGTTSLSAVTAEIKPTSQPQVFNTSNDVVDAFKIHHVQAIVVDLRDGAST